MIDLNSVNEIYLYTGTTDFRYGIYGLSRIVLSQFSKDDIKHNLYLFCSKSKKCIKIDDVLPWSKNLPKELKLNLK